MSFFINSFITVVWAKLETPFALLHPTTPTAPLKTPDFKQSASGFTVPAGSIWEFTTLSNCPTIASVLYPTVELALCSGINTFDLSLFGKFNTADLTISFAILNASSSLNSMYVDPVIFAFGDVVMNFVW